MGDTFPARYVMNTLLQRSFKEGRDDMSPMKAQKMLFFTHGWHLAITGHPAIDKNFEVWKYGPVVEQIYHDLKCYGNSEVSKYLLDEGTEKAFVVAPKNKKFYEVVDIVWENYIGFSAVQLSTMTHYAGTPWETAKNQGLSIIPNDMIRQYFVNQARNH